MPTVQAPITLSGSAVTVQPYDGLRKYLQIQNYVASASPMYIAFGFTATLKTLGELELSPGGIYIFGTVPPDVISPHITYSSPAPPVETISIFSAGASGSLMVMH